MADEKCLFASESITYTWNVQIEREVKKANFCAQIYMYRYTRAYSNDRNERQIDGEQINTYNWKWNEKWYVCACRKR